MKKLLGMLLVFCMLMGICPAAFAAEHAYEVNDIYFTDLAGNAMENPARSCVINVKATKISERIGNELVVIVAYATDGEMVNFTTVSGTMQKGEKEIFSTLMFIPTDKSVGLVKAFVWNNISEMRAMSAPFEKIVNKMDDGIKLPSVNDPPVGETYIPSTVTVEGMITATCLSNLGLATDTYNVILYPLELQADNAYTSDEYAAYVARMRAISEYYRLPLAVDDDQNIDSNVYSDIDLTEYLFYEGVFELSFSSGKYSVKAFEPRKSENIAEFSADDYVLQTKLGESNQYTRDNNKIRMGSTSYKMADEVEIYLNGAAYTKVKPVADAADGSNASQELLDTILGGAQGTIKFVKDTDSNVYTYILADFYQVAKVIAVEYKNNETTIDIVTKNALSDVTDYEQIVISDEAVEEGTTVVSVTRNGAAAELSSIVKGDIIAYAVDFAETDLDDPKSIKILATNETVTGKVTSVDDEDETHTIDGKEYKSVVFDEDFPALTNTYEITLDPFGRIYNAELRGTSTKYAIATKITSAGDIQLVLADGTTKTYGVKSGALSAVDAAVKDTANGIDDFEDYLQKKTLAPEKRVVEYTIKTSSSEITSIKLADGWVIDGKEYKSRTGKLGSYTISSSTQVIDVTEVNDSSKASEYYSFNIDNFKDGAVYTGVAYKTGSYTSFIILKEIGKTFSDEARFAVVKKAAQKGLKDGEYVDNVKVLYEGKEQTLTFLEDYYVESGLGVGDVFFFETDRYGCVDTVYIVYDYSKKEFTTLYNAALAVNGNDADKTAAMFPTGTDGWSYNLWDEGYSIRLAEGYVTDVTSTSIEIAAPEAVKAGILDTNKDIDDSKTDGVAIFSIDSSCVAYEYDPDNDNVTKENRFKVKDPSAVKVSSFDKFEVDGDKGVYTGIDASKGVYAVAMIVDGNIVAIYTITP